LTNLLLLFKSCLVTNIPEDYVLPGVDDKILANPRFNVEEIAGLMDGDVKTFCKKLHIVFRNGLEPVGTSETYTDSLVDDLLRIVHLNTWPLMIQ